MNTKRTLPISEARKRIFEIADEVQKPDHYYTLTDKGHPKAVIMSAEDFESWQETLEVMEIFPDLKERAKEADEEYKRGECITLEEVLAKRGFVVADKSKNKYGVSTRIVKKGKKRS